MRSTPTSAVEALGCLPPLELVVEGEARATAHRLLSHPNRGHSSILVWLQQSDAIFNMGVDVMRPAYNFEIKYMVTILTRDAGTPVFKGLVWITDGSKVRVRGLDSMVNL